MKTSQTLLLLLIVALLILGGAYFYTSRNKQVASQDKVVAPATVMEPANKDITWSYEDMGTNKDTWATSTKVTVTVWDKSYNVGTYAGSCAPRSHDGFGKDEVSGITCWWAGGGDDIGVFNTDGKVTIQHRTLDEGTAESSGIIGNFETVISI